jgi:hypothetical protein
MKKNFRLIWDCLINFDSEMSYTYINLFLYGLLKEVSDCLKQINISAQPAWLLTFLHMLTLT